MFISWVSCIAHLILIESGLDKIEVLSARLDQSPDRAALEGFRSVLWWFLLIYSFILSVCAGAREASIWGLLRSLTSSSLAVWLIYWFMFPICASNSLVLWGKPDVPYVVWAT